MSIPLPYNVVKEPLDTAQTDKRYQIPGTYLEFATDGSLTGISVRVGSKVADAIPLDRLKTHEFPAGFKEFYVTWTAQTGKKLYISTGREGSKNTRVECNTTQAGARQIFQKTITSPANAGDVIVATITSQSCLIKSIVVKAVAAQTSSLTSAGVYGGASKVITFITATIASQANLNATDKQVAFGSGDGPVELAATKTIVISLVGTGATPVNLLITIECEACVDGGHLA